MAFTAVASVEIGGVPTVLPYGDEFAMTRKLSETTEWTYTVADDHRELSPESTGDWAGVLDDSAYGSSGLLYNKILKVTGTQGPSSTAYALPHGIPNQYGYVLTEGDPDEKFQWQGRGIASKLYKPHLSLPAVISTVASPKYVQDVLAAIFTAYSIPYDVSGVSPNWRVARYVMQDGSPIEWIKNSSGTGLLDVTQAEWREEAGTIVCFQPVMIGTSYDRAYSTDTIEIKQLQSGRTAVETVNYVTCQRCDDTGGRIGSCEAKDQTFGRSGYTTFATPIPLSTISYRPRVQSIGKVSDFYFYGPSGGPPAAPIAVRDLKGAPPTIMPDGNLAYGVDFTFGAYIGGPAGATAGTYAVDFYGDATGGVYPDTTTSVIVKDDTSIATVGKFGLALGPNPAIADEATLTGWGTAVLAKKAKRPQRWQGQLRTFDPGLLPGMRVKVTDTQFSRDHYMIVQSVGVKLHASEIERGSTFEAIEYV